jgi:hypothetical protein
MLSYHFTCNGKSLEHIVQFLGCSYTCSEAIVIVIIAIEVSFLDLQVVMFHKTIDDLLETTVTKPVRIVSAMNIVIARIEAHANVC